jgi:hypothetical protein
MTMAEYVSKQELQQRLFREQARLLAVLTEVTPAEAQAPYAVGDWSIQDVLAHIVAHEQQALAELRAALQGESLAIQHDRINVFNAGAVYAWSPLPWSSALAAWEHSFREVVAAVDALQEADFLPTSVVSLALNDSIDGALANNTYGHYAEHLPGVREFVQRQREGLSRR